MVLVVWVGKLFGIVLLTFEVWESGLCGSSISINGKTVVFLLKYCRFLILKNIYYLYLFLFSIPPLASTSAASFFFVCLFIICISCYFLLFSFSFSPFPSSSFLSPFPFLRTFSEKPDCGDFKLK